MLYNVKITHRQSPQVISYSANPQFLKISTIHMHARNKQTNIKTTKKLTNILQTNYVYMFT